MNKFRKVCSRLATGATVVFIVCVFLLAALLAAEICSGAKELARRQEALQKENDELRGTVSRLSSEITGLNETVELLSAPVAAETPAAEPEEAAQKEKKTGSGRWEVGQEVPLPEIATNMKFFTDFRFYNVPGTPHKRLQEVCRTDEYGLRRFGEDYAVGLGSFYSIDIGDRFAVKLDSGAEFTVIVGDGKADCDTDETNRYTPCLNYEGEPCANVIEFIADTETMEKAAVRYGSADYYPHLRGNIVEMIYLGRDTSYDWDTYF